jgi:hypothetical protein
MNSNEQKEENQSLDDVSPMGDSADIMGNTPKSIPVLAKTEQNRAVLLDRRIIERADTINKQFKLWAKDLAEMNSRCLYFHFGFFSFQEYCQKRLGKSRQYIYKIIQAYDTMKFLENQGVSEQDTDILTERLAREIRDLPQYKQVLVAKAIARIKRQTGRMPTIVDVRTEAAKIDGTSDSARIERQQKEVLANHEKALGLTKNNSSIAFEVLTPEYRQRLTVVIMAHIQQLKTMLSSLNSEAVAARTQAAQDPAPLSEASEKARIIKEEIAEHHGEKPKTSRKREEDFSIQHPNGKRYWFAKPPKHWILDASIKTGARCIKCNKEVSAGYRLSDGASLPIASCDCETRNLFV